MAGAGAGTGAGALGPGVSVREADEDGEADALEEAELPPHANDGADDEQEHGDDEAENKEFSETISKVYKEQFDQERASIKLTNRQKFGISKKEVTPKVARKPKFKADNSMSP